MIGVGEWEKVKPHHKICCTDTHNVIDFETRSEANLTKISAYEYARHPSTQILCVGWGTHNNAKVWSPAFSSMPSELNEIFKNVQNKKIAHNAIFEQCITKYVLKFPTEPTDWICTASLSAVMALPRKLEDACQALGLKHQKDKEGHRLMLKLSKPRRITKTKNNKNKWHNSKEDLLRIMEYCRKDIYATSELYEILPALTDNERKIWLLDQEINLRGFNVDRKLVKIILQMIEAETINLDHELEDITLGKVRSARQQKVFLEWLQTQGVKIQDLRASTVFEELQKTVQISQKITRALQIRQEVSKSSTTKYKAFELRSRTDGRCRDNLMYHGASTGRWSGKGVQIHNLPRPIVKNIDFQVLHSGDFDMIRLLYGSPMNVFSSAIRNMIIPSFRRTFYCGDFASVETRVLFWIADHKDGLNAYRNDRPIYEEMAAVIYGKDIKTITKGERELGKRVVLGCGYGMGADKFKKTCKQHANLEITEDLAMTAVKAYRALHAPIPILWKNLERAAIAAVQNPKKKYGMNHTKWFMNGKFLQCELPSARRLSYYNPEVQYEATFWEANAPKLYHWHVNGMTKKWERTGTYGGALTENIVQAIARDLIAESMIRVENEGFRVVLSVHDEILAEYEEQDKLTIFCNLMAETPKWGGDIPIKVDGWEGDRYRK